MNRTEISRRLDREFRHLVAVARNVDAYYSEREITTAGGPRTLHVPTNPLKDLQRLLYRRVLKHLPLHRAAFCARGRGVLRAAQVHAGQTWFLHLDIRSFFPSITHTLVRQSLLKHIGPDAAPTIARLVTFAGAVPQGASTSVAIANLAALHLDRSLTGLCRQSGAGFRYTRYVDDIAISGGRRLARFEDSIRRIIEDCGWELNEKGGLRGAKERHEIFGLVINAQPSVDPNYLAALRLAVRRAQRGDVALSRSEVRSLIGKIRWVEAVKPEAGQRLLEAASSLHERAKSSDTS